MKRLRGADRRCGRERELALSELPGWGLEIMMGLYGPATIKEICAAELAGTVVPETVPRDRTHDAAERDRSESLSPVVVELAAMNEIARYLERKFRSRRSE